MNLKLVRTIDMGQILKLHIDEDSGKYYISPLYEDDNIFDVENEFKRVTKNGSKKYFYHNTKVDIIKKLRAMAKWSHECQLFIDWYDSLEKVEKVEKVEEKTKNVEKENYEMIELTNKIEQLTEEISKNNKMNAFEEAMLQGIINKGKELAVDDLKNEIKGYLEEFVRETYGALPQRYEIVNDNEVKELQGLFHKDYKKIISIVSQNVPLMLVGPAGSGKNHTVEQVAEALNLNFYFSNAITQEYKLTGFIDANGNYHETEFYKSFKNGGLFFFDEIDASCAESLIIVNAALSNGYFDFPHEKVYAHKDFRVVAAANTFGHGADMIYVGRNQLDGATLDRFAVVHFEYDAEIEKALCDDIQLYSFIYDMRNAIVKRNLRFIISMRATINASKLWKIGLTRQEIIKSVITKGMNRDDINTIINEMQERNQWYDVLKQEAR